MRIRTKLALAVTLAMCSVAILALLAQQHFTRRDFADYQQANRQQAADALAVQLAAVYEPEGSWDGYFSGAWRWPAIHLPLPEVKRGSTQPQRDRRGRGGPPHGGRGHPPPRFDGGPTGGEAGFAPGGRRPPLPPRRSPEERPDQHPDFSPLGNRPPELVDESNHQGGHQLADGMHVFTLHDGKRNALTRGFDSDAEMVWTAIKVAGETVGWLSFKLVPATAHPLDAEFEQQQRKLLLVLLGVAILLSLFVAWALSGLFLGRTRALLAATHKIAQGDLTVQVEPGAPDELGMLAIAFNRMTSDLQRSAERERNWLADVAHELRTPLATLAGEIEALQDGIRPLNKASMASLAEEVEHLGRLVNDLHFLSNSESGLLQLQRVPLELAGFIRGVIDQHGSALASAGLEPVSQLGDQAKVSVDPQRLRQVLDNIIQNAIRYAQPGALRFRLTTNEGEAVLQIEDSGPGVPAHELPKIFDRLYRVDTARQSDANRAGSGSGLGLAICKNLIEAHAGSISAAQGEVGGLLITVRLPLSTMNNITVEVE